MPLAVAIVGWALRWVVNCGGRAAANSLFGQQGPAILVGISVGMVCAGRGGV